MGKLSEIAGRFILTWFALSIVAFFISTFYSELFPIGIVVFYGLWLCAFILGIHAVVNCSPRVDRSLKLVVAMIPPWYVLARITMYGPEPAFQSLLVKYAFRTALVALMVAFACLAVYRLRLLDRDGPVGKRLDLD